MLLPKLADIFGISLDELFERESQSQTSLLSWPDDNILRVAVYVGLKMAYGGLAEPGYEYHYDGAVDGVPCCVSIICGSSQ